MGITVSFMGYILWLGGMGYIRYQGDLRFTMLRWCGLSLLVCCVYISRGVLWVSISTSILDSSICYSGYFITFGYYFSRWIMWE